MLKRKIKLLIIDDEKDICAYEKSYLEKQNLDVRAAQTGRDGIAIARKTKPDIALIDIHLNKGIDGLTTLKQLLKIQPLCKCIMTTWDKQRAAEARKIGAQGILIKPTQIKELEQAVLKAADSLKRQVR